MAPRLNRSELWLETQPSTASSWTGAIACWVKRTPYADVPQCYHTVRFVAASFAKQQSAQSSSIPSHASRFAAQQREPAPYAEATAGSRRVRPAQTVWANGYAVWRMVNPMGKRCPSVRQRCR